MTRYAIALGSNQGDRAGHLRGAVDGMGGLGSVVAVSGLYETEPIGGPDQAPFLNAVAILDTSLPPAELLERLQAIEDDDGREREVRWGPRTLDLDIVAVDGGPVDQPGLQIPHPRAAERRFVLQPLVEVWPEADIGGGVTAGEALGSVSDQEVDLLAPRWVAVTGVDQGRYWVGAQLVWFATIAFGLVYDGSLPGSGLDPIRVTGGALVVIGAVIALLAARSLGRRVRTRPSSDLRRGLPRDVGCVPSPRQPGRHGAERRVGPLLLGQVDLRGASAPYRLSRVFVIPEAGPPPDAALSALIPRRSGLSTLQDELGPVLGSSHGKWPRPPSWT
jgi:2-amino-4-hydroxy-6-hydroxymethyldihydropteridine diphosphokinase